MFSRIVSGTFLLLVVVFVGCGNDSRQGSSAPRFLYFGTGAHPSGVKIDQAGVPGPQQDFPNPDPGRGMGIVAANPSGTFLYVSEFESTGSGQHFVAQFSIDHESGALTHIRTIPVENDGAVMKADPKGSVLALGGASVSIPDRKNPSVALYKIESDGNLTAIGAPVSVFGQDWMDLLFDASGQNLYVLSKQGDPAPPGSSLQSFRVDSSTGSLTLVQSIPLSINATELAVAGSNYVYVSGVGDNSGSIAGYSIKADGSLAPITGTPFGAGVNAFGLAASPSGSTVYATDLLQQRVSWFSVSSAGALTLAGSTNMNSIIPGEKMLVARDGKHIYSTACNPAAPPPGCQPALWGGTIQSDGSITPLTGTPFLIQVLQFDLVY